MSFGEHLEELRKRLFISLIAVIVAVLGLLPFKTQVTGIYIAPYEWMWGRLLADYITKVEHDAAAVGGPEALHPLKRDRYEFIEVYGPQALNGTLDKELLSELNTRGGFPVRPTLVAIGGLEDFWTFMAASLLFGLVLAAPVVLYQVWAFIAAGLYRNERKVVLKYVPFAVTLLLGGVVFGYAAVVPWGTYFLMKLMNFLQIEPMLSVSQYFTLLLTLTGALGAVFQLPLVMLALQKVGIATYVGMRRSWRYVILGIFVLSAVLTPSPDPFTQLMMAGPMCLLYLLGLVVCWRAR